MEKRYLLLSLFLLLFTHSAFANLLNLSKETILNPFNDDGGLYAFRDTLNDPTASRGSASDESRARTRKIKKKAKKQYSQLGYKAAMAKYKSLDEGSRKGESELLCLANAHRLNGETEDAEFYYEKLVKMAKDPIHLLHYAQVLQSNEKCKEAIRWYNEYKHLADPKDLEHRSFITECEEDQIEILVHKNVEVRNVKELNSPHLDFAPFPYKNGIVFTSTRGGRDQLTKDTDNWTSDNFSDVFFSEIDGKGNFSEPRPFKGTANSRYHDGSATFNTGENNVYFTRSNNSKNKDGNYELQVYHSVFENNKWTKAEAMSFNSNDFSSCHPALSYDERALYFASNRPGGYGGMDIYVSVMEGGKWSEAQNLGPNVNSSGNEVFPFISDDGQLYFASNGHVGMGGLDIFKATKESKTDEKSWSGIKNMGLPFNSQKDDFGFYFDADSKTGFLSSSRIGGKGKDDLYSWKETREELIIEEKPIAAIPVPSPEPVKERVITNQPIINLMPDNTGLFERFLGEADAKFEKGETFTLNDVYYDYGKYEIRPDATPDLNAVVKLMRAKPEMIIALESHTDARGKSGYNQQLSQKRAEAAKQFVVAQGISGHRIQAIGFGESRSKNHCVDGTNCSEDEHQENRRTEIRILELGF